MQQPNEQVPGVHVAASMSAVYRFECFDKDGNLKWVEEIYNTTVNAGLNSLLDVYFKSATQITTWYCGLKNSGTIAAADTMASHAGWTENVSYSQANRPTWTGGSVASQSVSNTASQAQFSMNASYTVTGGFLVSNNTKSGTTGTLYGAADFTTPRSGDTGDTINLTVTLAAASA